MTTKDWRIRGDRCSKCTMKGCVFSVTCPPKYGYGDACEKYEEMNYLDLKNYFRRVIEQEHLNDKFDPYDIYIGYGSKGYDVVNNYDGLGGDCYYLEINKFPNAPKLELEFLNALRKRKIGWEISDFKEKFFRCVYFMSKRFIKLIYFSNIRVYAYKSDAFLGRAYVGNPSIGANPRIILSLDHILNNSIDSIISTYIHECIHHLQYQNNLIQDLDSEELRIWISPLSEDNKVVKGYYNNYGFDMKHKDRPWEKHAYELEARISEEFRIFEARVDHMKRFGTTIPYYQLKVPPLEYSDINLSSDYKLKSVM